MGKIFKSGPGFGGSCFKKDILNLIYLCNFYGLVEVADWESVLKIILNQTGYQINRTKIIWHSDGKRLAILGFAFKANTNDTRESSAIKICKNLIDEGANLSIYDPKVNEKQIEIDLCAKPNYEVTISSWSMANSIYEAANNADAVVVLTEWEEFKKIDWGNVSKRMRSPSWLIDTRNIVNIKYAIQSGLKVWRLGVDS